MARKLLRLDSGCGVGRAPEGQRGDDRRSLFACTGTTHDRDVAGRIRSAKLEATTVDVPGAGVS